VVIEKAVMTVSRVFERLFVSGVIISFSQSISESEVCSGDGVSEVARVR